MASVRLVLALLLLPGALAGCSGTPFGDQLANSFSAAPGRSQAPAAAANPQASGQPAATAPRNPQQPAGAQQPAQAKPAAVRPAPPRPPQLPSAAPAPYRVTLQLPAADPSAPAEAVTQALRAAGVAFEVETIERIPAAPAAVAPQRTPAPAPR